MVNFLNHRHNHLIAPPKILQIRFFVTQVRWKFPMLLKSRLSNNLRSTFGSVHFHVLQPFGRPLFITVSLPTLFSWLGISSPFLLSFHPFLTPDRIYTSCKPFSTATSYRKPSLSSTPIPTVQEPFLVLLFCKSILID